MTKRILLLVFGLLLFAIPAHAQDPRAAAEAAAAATMRANLAARGQPVPPTPPAPASSLGKPATLMEQATSPKIPTALFAVILSTLTMVLGQLMKSPMFGEWLKAVTPRQRTAIMFVLGFLVGGAGTYLESSSFSDAFAAAFSAGFGALGVHEVVAAAAKLKTGVKDRPSASPPIPTGSAT